MTSTLPSPTSSPSSIPPVPSNSTLIPPASQPDPATVTPPPPVTPATAPPLQLPPLPVANPPPPPDTSPPPPPDTSTPAAPAPASPATAPPSPLPVTATPPPPDAPVLSSPPPPDTTASPPSPTPPDPTPSTPSPPLSPSSPPPEIIPSPPASTSPPPPHTNPPKNPPPNQVRTPPSNASITPPVSTSSPPLPTSNSSISGSPDVQLPTSRETDTRTTGRLNDTSGGSKTGGVVAISLAVGFVTLSLFLMAVWFKRRQKRRDRRPNVNYIMPSPSASSQKSDSHFLKFQQSTLPLVGNPSLTNSVYSPPDRGGVGNSRAWFTYEELAEATDGFSGSNLLGEGGFGCVYKGLLADGREVAIKQLKIGGGQGEREFRAEVEIISRVHHRHLVSLVGYCISDHQRLLVYQYVPNNTLHYHLHGEGRPVMDWAN